MTPKEKELLEAQQELEKYLAFAKEAEDIMDSIFVEVVMEYEKSNIIETLTAKTGERWYLVKGIEVGNAPFWADMHSARVGEGSYLADLKGHRIYRTYYYEGHRIANEDAWSINGFFCSSKQKAIDCFESPEYKRYYR